MAPAAAGTVAGEAPTTTEAPAAPAPKAPASYDWKAVADKVNPDVLAKFEGIARELDMSQEAATKLIDNVAPELVKAQQAQHTAQVAQWGEQSKTDPEIGGAKFAENLAVAKKALDTFGSPELTQLLDSTGLGNHPEVIRAFMRAGQKISSGPVVHGSAGAQPAVDAAARLYPNMK